MSISHPCVFPSVRSPIRVKSYLCGSMSSPCRKYGYIVVSVCMSFIWCIFLPWVCPLRLVMRSLALLLNLTSWAWGGKRMLCPGQNGCKRRVIGWWKVRKIGDTDCLSWKAGKGKRKELKGRKTQILELTTCVHDPKSRRVRRAEKSHIGTSEDYVCSYGQCQSPIHTPCICTIHVPLADVRPH